jgi:hypothetical protein
MKAPGQSFADAIDVVCQRHSAYKGGFFDRIRQCTCLPPARTPNDYVELVRSLVLAWLVATIWPKDRRFQQHALRIRELIRLLLEADGEGLDLSVRQALEQRAQVWAERAQDVSELMDVGWVEELGFPKRRDHLTFADLGRERRGAGPLLFVREVSATMRAIFGKPHDKIVGVLAGLAFETKPLTAETVRTMRKKPV